MSDCDVVVIGLGPVGAVLAGLLGQQGLRVTVIERSREVYPLPRAAHFDHEIMRVFQSLGIADEALTHARPAGAYEFRNARGDLLMSARRGDEAAPSGWAYAYMFNQPGVEGALRDRLGQMDNVAVRLGDTFVALERRPDDVVVRARTEDGTDVRLTAAYVVGCDGAWSPVREALGIPLEDYAFDEPWLVVDTRPRDPERMPKVNLQICDPARPTTCVLMGPGWHRWEFMLLPGEDAETVLAPGFVERLLEGWNVDVEIGRRAVYRFHGLVAERWRDGRVLIAGDAAHQMPPFAGQGMCSGVRDAANLAWKLAAVIGNDADPRLLDTYQSERERSVRDYIELAIEMGRVVCTLDPEKAAARDAAMIADLAAHAGAPTEPIGGPSIINGAFVAGDGCAGQIFPQPVSADGQRLDDVLGSGAWLICRTTAAGAAVQQDGMRVVGLDDAILAPFRVMLAGWLDEHCAEAVLVRPDRYIFGAGDADELAAAWRAVMAGRPALASAA